MESANFHHHQQQEDQQLNLEDSSCYGLSWYHNLILNGARNHTNSRDVSQTVNQNIDLAPVSMESFMAHELQHLGRIKNELSVIGSYSELPDIISNSPISSVENFMSKNDHQRIGYNHHNSQDMLLKTFSNGCQIKSDQVMNQVPSYEESVSYSNDTNSCYRGTFSQIFPALNISYLNQSSTSSISSSTFDINLPAIDPIGYQPSSSNVHNVGGLFKDNCLSNGFDHLQYSKIAPEFFIETTEVKRPANSYTDAKESKATPTKKSKLELRPSCTPLKVRKEKLGDRIASLQQMVAPFGKTDTASVLMDAIGYIKFLQSQVETLSVPYMKSKHKASRISTQRGSIKDVNEDIKRDLRSQGLCLVPISCLSYVTYGGGSVWANP